MKYIIFFIFCFLCNPITLAVDIVLCEDDEGNQSFQKACPPGTHLVEKKKVRC